jgi:hypothetical protein
MPFIIMPTSYFRSFWNFVTILILTYTATYMPYKTCFIDYPSQASENLETVIDCLFTLDIFICFLSASEKADGTLVHHPREIAAIYIRSWFFFDVLAVFPFDLVFGLITSSDDISAVVPS